MERPDREAVLQENYRLSREIGYAGFRERLYNDPDAVKEWPDPTVRERELRNFWDVGPEGGFASFAQSHANETMETLIAYRDYLRGVSASGVDAQIAFYERTVVLGRRERLGAGGDRGGEGGDISPAYETLVMRLPGDFDSPLSREELKSLAEEIRQDEHAARVRDFGEADAATYDARMAEAYRHRAEVLGHPGSAEPPPMTDAELERLVAELERSWAEGHGTMRNPSPGDLAEQRDVPDVGRTGDRQSRGRRY